MASADTRGSCFGNTENSPSIAVAVTSSTACSKTMRSGVMIFKVRPAAIARSSSTARLVSLAVFRFFNQLLLFALRNNLYGTYLLTGLAAAMIDDVIDDSIFERIRGRQVEISFYVLSNSGLFLTGATVQQFDLSFTETQALRRLNLEVCNVTIGFPEGLMKHQSGELVGPARAGSGS